MGVFMSRVFSAVEVAAHNTENDCWIIVNGKVYDVTQFMKQHPGGKKVLLSVAGKDASTQFQSLHQPGVLLQHKSLCVGSLAGENVAQSRSASTSPEDKYGSK